MPIFQGPRFCVPSLVEIGFGEDENAKSLRQRHNKYNNDNDLQRTNFDQKSLLEPSAQVILKSVCRIFTKWMGLTDLKKFINFTFFLPPILPPLRMGAIKFTISCLLTLPSLVKLGPVVLEKNMFTDATRRRTPTQSNRSPEWLRWTYSLSKNESSYLSPMEFSRI